MKVLGSKKPLKKVTEVGEETQGPSEVDVTKILDSITLDMDQNTKIAIVGKNGCGKRFVLLAAALLGSSFPLSLLSILFSTLLKLITQYGEIPPPSSNSAVHVISGEIFKHPNMKIAYYQQHQADCLPYELTPLQHLTNVASSLTSGEGGELGAASGSGNRFNEQALRAHLGAFGIGGDLALQQIGVLSGGQKSRVVFAELTLQK
jgi:ATP-binding cassette, subfamily F, member 3